MEILSKSSEISGTAETSWYTLVFGAVQFSLVSVPVKVLERNIPAILAGTVRNHLPCSKPYTLNLESLNPKL